MLLSEHLSLPLHSLVIDTLKEVDPSRKCFRLVGGVLVERTVKEVLPALENNKEQVRICCWTHKCLLVINDALLQYLSFPSDLEDRGDA